MSLNPSTPLPKKYKSRFPSSARSARISAGSFVTESSKLGISTSANFQLRFRRVVQPLEHSHRSLRSPVLELNLINDFFRVVVFCILENDCGQNAVLARTQFTLHLHEDPLRTLHGGINVGKLWLANRVDLVQDLRDKSNRQSLRFARKERIHEGVEQICI